MNTLGHRSWGQCSLPDTLGCVGGEIAPITAVCLTGQVHSRHSGAKFQSLPRSAKNSPLPGKLPGSALLASHSSQHCHLAGTQSEQLVFSSRRWLRCARVLRSRTRHRDKHATR